jgi:hypothetical protein
VKRGIFYSPFVRADAAAPSGAAQMACLFVRALQGAADLKPVTGAPVYLRLGRAAKQAGMRYFVYAIGSVTGGTFDFILQAVR